MEIIDSWEDLPKNKKIVLALGFFDGCHLGHREVFRAAGRLAEKAGAIPGVLTFWPHPMTVIAPSRHVPLLQSREEKAASMEKAGMDFVIFYKPDEKFLAESPELPDLFL